MKNKNKFILGVILGIFLIGLVSASITGYLVSRGGGIADAGYTAVLQKVEGTTAIVSVRTPTGDSELVRVEEGKTAQVGEAQISASDLTRGTLFTRGKAEVSIDVTSNPVAKIASGVSSASCPNNQLLELGVLKVDSITNNCASKLSIGAPEIGIGSGTGGVTIDSQGIVTIIGFPIRLNSKQVEIGTAKESVIIKGYAYFNTLKGNGNAYACLDTNGMLFRSLTPCI